MRARVARHRERIHVRRLDTRVGKAGANRLRRETGNVLDARKSLLFDSGHQPAITDERRRDVAVVGVDPEHDHVSTGTRRIAA